MRVDINTFTYLGDADLIKGFIRNMKQVVPYAYVHIIADAANPLPKELISYIRKVPKVDYRESLFKRNGNLNGKEAIVGILNTMLSTSPKGEDSISIKIDTDTIISKDTWIQKFANSRTKYLASPRPLAGVFSGVCYAFKRDLLEKTALQAQRTPLYDTAPEDICVGCLAVPLSFPEGFTYAIPYTKETPNGTWIGWSYTEPKTEKRAMDFVSNMEVITVGNYHMHEGFTKQDRVEIQRLLVDALYKIH